MYSLEVAVALSEESCLRLNRECCAANGELVIILGTFILLKPNNRFIVQVGDDLADIRIDDDEDAVVPVFNEHRNLDHFRIRATVSARSWGIVRRIPMAAWRCPEPVISEEAYAAEVKRSWDRHCEEVEEQLKRNGGDL